MQHRLFWAPLFPHQGSFHEQRSLGMGLASVLGDLMARHGLEFPTYGVRPGQYSTPCEFFLQAGGQPGWAAVCGSYDNDLSELRFRAIDLAASKVVEERSFQGPGGKEAPWTGPLAGWLRRLQGGAAVELPAASGTDPQDVGELLTEAHAAGLRWVAGEASNPFEEEFVRGLQGAFGHFESQIGRADSEPSLRMALLWLAQEVGDYQRRQTEADDPDGDADILGQLRSNLDLLPIKPIWGLLQEGIRQGADPLAFRACRGYVHLALGRPTSALEDFRLLRKRLPLHGHLALARAYERMEEPDQAVREFTQAVALAADGQPFSDIVAGRDHPQIEGAASMGAHLLFARGRCQWLFGRFGPAQRDLEAAQREDGLRDASLEILAHLFRDWAIALDRQGVPQAADKLKRHLKILESLYSLRPNVQDVEAAIDAARRLGDSEALQRWRKREGMMRA